MSLSYIKRADQDNRSALYVFFAHCATILLTLGALVFGQISPIMLAISIKLFSQGMGLAEILKELTEITTLDKMLSYFPYHVGFSLIMIGFITLIFALWFCVKFIHRRKFSTLWSDQDKFRWKDFLKGLFISLVLFVAADLIIHSFNPNYHTWVFNPSKFWIYLPFAIVLIPFQTLAEELFFRGYLYQTAGLATKSMRSELLMVLNHIDLKLNWKLAKVYIKITSVFSVKWQALLISAIIFGVFHFGNPEMSIDFWKMGIIYIGSGLMIGLSVMISRGIEFGWGFHLINNLYLSTISTFPGSALNGPTLYAIPKPSGDRILLEFGIQFLVFGAILLIVYHKNIKGLLDKNA